ncbi:MAG: tRNA-dihydrouridine synthase family protein [Clostridia bacterium]|nr:tRNA-dihydrouridine synthase family protein [Clostridia bacterium]
MKIGNIEIENNLILAPMAGVTDIAFRELCKHFGAGLTVTEMVSVKALLFKNKKTQLLLETFLGEKPCAVQIFGHCADDFERVLKSGVLDKFDIIDINMGCPAPKIVKNGDGSALLKNFSLAREIVETCVKSTNKPVTVKLRKGFYENDDVLVLFAKMIEGAGASAITIHPRTKSQNYSGKIDINDIKKVKESVKIPVIGNGDVVDIKSYENMLKTGCDSVMIGRRAVGCPEIFSILSGKNIDLTKTEIIKLHLDILKKYYDEKFIAKVFIRHAFSYASFEEGAVEKRKKLAFCKTLSEMEEVLFEK